VRRICLQSLSKKLDLVDSTLRNHAARVALTSDAVVTEPETRRRAVRKTSTCLREGPVGESQRPGSVFWALAEETDATRAAQTRELQPKILLGAPRTGRSSPAAAGTNGGRLEPALGSRVVDLATTTRLPRDPTQADPASPLRSPAPKPHGTGKDGNGEFPVRYRSSIPSPRGNFFPSPSPLNLTGMFSPHPRT
jgi:hypothetical protein